MQQVPSLTQSESSPPPPIHHQPAPIIVDDVPLLSAMHSRTAALQVANDRIALEIFKGSAMPTNLQTKLEVIHTMSLDSQGAGFLVVSDNSKVEIYQIKEGLQVQQVSSFTLPPSATSPPVLGVHTDSIYLCQGNKIEVLTQKGITKQSLVFSETEGEVQKLHINGDYLVAVTSNNYIKMFDLSRREARIHGASRKFDIKDGFTSNAGITSAKINQQGSLVSILGNSDGVPSSRIIVYVIDRDIVYSYDFDHLSQYPVNHFWDASEPRLLCCQTNSRTTNNSDVPATKPALAPSSVPIPPDQPPLATSPSNAKPPTSFVSILFVTSDHAPVLQDQTPLPTDTVACIGVEAPYVFFRAKRSESATVLLKGRVMRDFIGMEAGLDEQTKQAMLDFGYHMTLGHMDEAYRAVAKLVKNAGVWTHLARMSVQTQRLDVLAVSLGNMGHARAAKALREAIASDPDQPLVHLAVVAIHLGMGEEAMKLLALANRPDILNSYHQATGDWEHAVQIANTKDRIHLRTTHYSYAKHLELLGDLPGAISQYEAALAHRTEVPRMLLSVDAMSELEAYIDNARDKTLYAWRAKYCESKAQWDLALKYYELAGDYLSLIRIRCFQGNFEEAKRIAMETQDRAASYHLAHLYENDNNIREALQMYSRAECFNHGIRLAIEHELDADLMNLSLQSGAPRLMVQAAQHFEEKGNMEKAVLLYQKGGAFRHAVQLCISAKLYEQLESVINDLDSEGNSSAENSDEGLSRRDPDLLAQCASFFIEHHQFERAAHLLVLAGEGEKALELYLAHNIPISEEVADKIAPPLRPEETPESSGHKINLLRLVAKCCKRQGAYHLATKKYTQAKDKLKAMKVLLKSGDTEKIIFFAGVSRQQDIYIMAANYLQTLNWRSEPEIMKQIVSFYTKAKAPASLALFYEACSQVEIDEYQNYEKALGALREAQRHMVKARAGDRDPRLVALTSRIQNIERFLQARKMTATPSEAEEAVTILKQLLDTPDINFSVRVGDIVALLVSYYYMQGTRPALGEAFALIDRLVKARLDVFFYLEEKLVKDIYARLGLTFESMPPETAHHGIEEDIKDD